MARCFVSLVVALLGAAAQGTALGALKLDNYTIDKTLKLAIDAGSSLLVKFDESYAYGEKEDEFKTLCKLAYGVGNLLVGEVPVQEYGDKENSDVAEKYGLKKDNFPAYFLFNQENRDGLKYSGAVKAADIAAWLRKSKVPMPAIGTIEELDVIAKKFLKEGLQDSEIAAAKALSEGDYKNDRKASMYVKIMEKIKAKGEGYVAEETKRVGKILDGKISADKRSELGDKVKILAAFQMAKDEL